jgi:hypothetical protein
VTLVNDEAPTIKVTAADFRENEAAEGDVAGTYVTADAEGGDLTVSFTGDSNAAGYYVLANGRVELTSAGAAHVNAGGTLPAIELTVTDNGGLTGTGKETPEVTLVNDEAPTIKVTAADFRENEAAEGDVAGTYVTADAEGGDLTVSFTGDSNAAGYYVLANGRVELTSAGAAHVNAGGTLPAIELTVTDNGGLTGTGKDTPEVTLVNDEAPTIKVTAADFRENEAAEGDVAGTYVTADAEGGDLTVSFTGDSNAAGYYVLANGRVELTSAGAAHVNAGGTLPAIELTVTDNGGLTGTGKDTPEVTLVNDEAPTIKVTAADFRENEAAEGDVAGTYVTADAEGGDLTVSFTGDSNAAGYYVLANGRVELTSAGAAHVNAGGTLPAIELTVTDNGGLTGTGKDTPEVTLVNDEAPTIKVTAADFRENEAAEGDVAGTYVTADAEGGDLTVSFTGDSNAAGYYVLANGRVELTSAGAAHVNAGGTLPAIELTVTDNGGLTGTGKDTPEVTLVNDEAPTIKVTAADFRENEAAEGDVAGTYVTADAEGGDLTVSFTGDSNAAGYYVLANGRVELTSAGAAHVNAGGTLPAIELTVTDNGGLTGTGKDTPEVTLVNDEAPTIKVTAADFRENEAAEGDVAGTYVTADAEGGDLTVSFTGDSNAAGYYVLANGRVELTSAGAAHVNAGGTLPAIELTVTDNGGLTGTGKDTPEVTLVNDAPAAVDDGSDLSASSGISGLFAEYYAYFEAVGANARDGSNLSSIQQVLNFVGSNQPDAVFLAKNVSYGEIQGSLATDTKLQTFLGTDAASLNTDPVDSTDGIVHMSGQVYLQDGTYKFKVLADDGYQIVVDGQIVAQYDGNQSPYSREGSSFTVSAGWHDIQIVYWDQAGQAVFKPSLGVVNAAGVAEYVGFSATNSAGDYIYPTRHASSFVTTEDKALSISVADILKNDSDPDGDALTVTSVSNAQHGTAALVNGAVVFTPTANFSGIATAVRLNEGANR